MLFRKLRLFLCLGIMFGGAVLSSEAQAPPTYFNSANTLDAATLRNSLNEIVSFDMVVTSFGTSASRSTIETINEDPLNSSNVILLWGAGDSRPKGPGGPADGDPTTGTWDREHLFPQSFFNSAEPMVSDFHALMPADADINQTAHSNRPYDTAVMPFDWNDVFGNRANFSPEDIFEPNDAEKGDAARAIFYMDIRYEGNNGEPDLIVNENGPVGTGLNTMTKLSTLLAWHAADPPAGFELTRNDRTFNAQNNANPFIQHPEWVDIIYGTPPAVQNGDSIVVGSTNRAGATVAAGAADEPMISLTLNLSGGEWDIGQLDITKLGTIPDGDVTAVKLWLDADNDGIVNRVDPLLDTQTFAAGSATFNLGTPFRLIPGSRDLLITASIAGTATAGDTLQIQADGSGLRHSATGGSDLDPSFAAQTSNTTTVEEASASVKIVMVSTRGSSGAASEEFVVLANQTGSTVDLTGWELRSRAGASTSTNTTALSGSVAPGDHFIVADDAYNINSVEGVVGDLSVTTIVGGMGDTTNRSMALFDSGGTKIDGFSFAGGADNPLDFNDGTPFAGAVASATTEVYARKRPGGSTGPYTDTDDNASDLEVRATKTPPSDAAVPVEVSGFRIH